MGGGETLGNSLGRAPLGRSDTEATTGWMDGKPWETPWGELRWDGRETEGNILGIDSSVGRERDRTDGRVDGGESMGNSLGTVPLGRSEMEATIGWTEGK